MKLLHVGLASMQATATLYHENGGTQIVGEANDETSYAGVLKILNRVCCEQKLQLKAATLENTHLATAHLFYLEAQ